MTLQMTEMVQNPSGFDFCLWHQAKHVQLIVTFLLATAIFGNNLQLKPCLAWDHA